MLGDLIRTASTGIWFSQVLHSLTVVVMRRDVEGAEVIRWPNRRYLVEKGKYYSRLKPKGPCQKAKRGGDAFPREDSPLNSKGKSFFLLTTNL